MDKITIVTAFFDINRAEFKGYNRSVENYFNYFERWAEIKNDLIFFCENKDYANKVLEIRNKFGLKEKTKTVVLSSLIDIDKPLYEKLVNIEKDTYFQNFRLKKQNPENKATYNFVMYSKFYCIYQASLLAKDTQLVWLDFGFEHGGETFKGEHPYDFEWIHDFGDKINLFYKTEITTIPIFEIIRTLSPDCIMGCLFTCPIEKAKILWDIMQTCYHNLADIGLMDDDQVLLLLAYRLNIDKFTLHKSSWFLPIKEFGNKNLQLIEHKQTFFSKFKNILKKFLLKK